VEIAQTDEECGHFCAISVERKISHPAIAAITEAAREWLVIGVTQQREQTGSQEERMNMKFRMSGQSTEFGGDNRIGEV